MRWSIIRTIWLREMRDQMRDRRTLLMIFGLPVVLYPLLGIVVLQFAAGFTEKPMLIGVVTGSIDQKDFPPRQPLQAGLSVLPDLAWLSAIPMPGVDAVQWANVCALAHASHQTLDYPLLIRNGQFTTFDATMPPLQARESISQARLSLVFLDLADAHRLDERKVDLILKAPRHFYTSLEQNEDNTALPHPAIQIQGRPGDDRSKIALRRLTPLLDVWKNDLKKVRLARKGLSESYLDPFALELPEENANSASMQNVMDMVVRIFPFMLVMWSLAGAMYPAVDLCAGEKERGTMETLLITPAGREEIVLGKFLTIWVFSAGTALLNLLSMGISTTLFSSYMPQQVGISVAALLWCVVLSLPQSAFFSAISLAIGAYARSSKEGQYYLMPLFVLTMPLIFLTLAPGVELNPFYSMVPVTGVALLMQRLMTAPNLSEIPWAYFLPVLAPIGLYSWLALRWAIEQFNREEVLFREAERLDVLLWFKRLLRDKAPVPTTGEAFFCLGLLLGLRWFTLGLGRGWSLEMHTAISELAFVAMPPLFMIILLNTQPADGLYLRWPHRREAGLAVLLALLLLPVMTGLTQAVALWSPHLLEGLHPLIEILRALNEGRDLTPMQLLRYFLAFALVPALCEEIAFRGFVLRGLHHGFRPRNAVLLSSFFFALFHMNVFLFLPTFLLGVALGLMTVRSRSLLPAMLFHLLYNSILIALIPLHLFSKDMLPLLIDEFWPWLIVSCLAGAGGLLWWLYRKPYIDLARREAAEQQAAGGRQQAE